MEKKAFKTISLVLVVVVIAAVTAYAVAWARAEGVVEHKGDSRLGSHCAVLIDDATTTGAQNSAVVPYGAFHHGILVDIQTGTITVRPEFSGDGGTTWIAGNDITEDGLHTFDAPVQMIRMNVTAISGGTVDVWWCVVND